MSEISGLPYKANCFIISPYYQRIFPPALSAASILYFLYPKNIFGHTLYTWPIIILFHYVSEEVILNHS